VVDRFIAGFIGALADKTLRSEKSGVGVSSALSRDDDW
jgi:hypothetical protein